MQPLPADAPEVRVEAVEAAPDEGRTWAREDAADIGLIGGGRLKLERGRDVVRFEMPRVPPASDLLHPYLAPAVALWWHWHGREALHAGAVAFGDGAVLIVGRKESGKSTTIAALARAGLTVLADDLSVIVDGRVLAGPRSIDLRSAAEGQVVRDGERVRVDLPPAPASAPIAGTVFLGWGETCSLDVVPAAERLTLLAQERSFYYVGGSPSAVLDLAALPAFRLCRPRELESLPEALELLRRRFG